MEDFLTDIQNNLVSYYNKLVDLTPKLLLALVILVIVWMLAVRARVFADKRLRTRMHDPLLATFIANLIKAVLIIVGVFIMFRIIGLTSIAGSILAGAGISAFIIGFALKDIGENFLAGILLAFKRPFSIGDIIESNGVKGKVMALNLRDTQISSDGKNIYIPNAMLIKNTLTNYNHDGSLMQDLTFGLEYGSDYEKAITIVKEILESEKDITIEGHQNIVILSGILEGVPQLNVRYWVQTDRTVTDGRIRSEMLVTILNALKESGFVIK